jgi:hypothetical protein
MSEAGLFCRVGVPNVISFLKARMEKLSTDATLYLGQITWLRLLAGYSFPSMKEFTNRRP